MKRRVIGAVSAVVGLLLVGCEPFLLFEEPLPEFKPPADKALCVMIRPSQTAVKMAGKLVGGFDANALAIIYVDGKLVGGLQENSVTSFEVEPGEHLVPSKVKTMSKVKYNFQPGKVYYISQGLMPIPFVGTGQALKPITPDEYRGKLADNTGALRYTRLNPNVPGEDLDPEDVKDELEDWAEWAEDNPEDAKVEMEYPGY
ncbi:MAG: hypothetical protein GF331_04940 [Chitinivibrionales bacterium]|nr:hypothetical protein [Chitinivibrionales bacterium]